MAITTQGPAPYASVANVLRAIEHYREKMPPVFTKELLVRLGYPNAYAVRTLRALRLLDLIDDEGVPSDALRELRGATDDEFPARLEQVVRKAYGDMFEVVDPATDSRDAILKAFAFNEPAAQRDRMVVLFLGLCEAAGMLPAGKAPRKRGMRGSPATSNRSGTSNGASRTKPNPKHEGVVKNPPPTDPPRPATTAKAALKARYIEVLIEKAATSDDDKLLDRIEALLREDETRD
jgi:Family of unknown function (DUF5343)